MNRILKTGLIVFLSIFSFTAFGQTFTYVTDFRIDNVADDLDVDDICITVQDGKIYVQDDSDDEVHVYNANSPYNFLGAFGDPDMGDIEEGITIYNGRIYVANEDDVDSDFVIDVFDLDYNHIEQIDFGTNPCSGGGFAIADGKILKVDCSEITVYDLDGNQETSFSESGNTDPSGIALNEDYIFVADDSDDQVYVYNRSDYSYVGATSDTDGLDDNYDNGMAIICDYLLVLDDDTDGDSSDDKIDVYSAVSPFSYISSFGSDEFSNNNTPDCIAVDGNYVFIAEEDSDDRIVIYELEEGCRPIPTMSQWGIIAMSLMLLIFGVMQIKYIISARKMA